MTSTRQHQDLLSRICRRAARGALALAVVFVPAVVATAVAQAQSFKVLYQFKGGKDGASPNSGVIVDSAGNIYGTTVWGGDTGCPDSLGLGCGTVFKISKAGKETVLYRFKGGTDGMEPQASLLLDAEGNLYGTTHEGGGGTSCQGVGCGTVFKISKAGKETVLYRFGAGANGGNANSPLVQDSAGNFYGTAMCCGAYTDGTVWKLDKAGQLTVLHAFSGADGDAPYGSLLLDAKGNLYGTTYYGGHLPCDGPPPTGCGVVFKVDATGHETVLHKFTGKVTERSKDGQFPYAGVIQDAEGNLYGTTTEGGENTCSGGDYTCGTVFKVTPTGKETLLYTFKAVPDGDFPEMGGALVMDAAGALYGEAELGGASGFYGTVFKVDTTGKEATLYNFTGGSDGAWPWGGLFRDAKGTLYGTAIAGGYVNSSNCPEQGITGYSCGTVFEIVP